MSMGPTNEDRAEWALLAVESFRHVVNMGGEDLDTVISDLLADLRHLADSEDLDFEEMLQWAYAHYEAEVNGDE